MEMGLAALLSICRFTFDFVYHYDVKAPFFLTLPTSWACLAALLGCGWQAAARLLAYTQAASLHPKHTRTFHARRGLARPTILFAHRPSRHLVFLLVSQVLLKIITV